MSRGTVIVTGASDGIGAAAVRRLAASGYHVVVVGLEAGSTRAVAAEIGAPWYTADYADLSQVRDLAARLLADLPRIDVLVNNAGAIFGHRRLTTDGNEITLQVDYLAPYLLTRLLLPRLIESGGRVVTTASVSARLYGRFDLDDLQNAHDYSPERAYGNSKVALILLTRELQRRVHALGVDAVSFHPGNLATGFARGSGSWMRFVLQSPLKVLVKGPEAGAQVLCGFVEGVPGRDWIGGEYYEDGVPAVKQNPAARDMALAAALWNTTNDLLRLDPLEPTADRSDQ